MNGEWLATWGGWLFGGISLLVTILLAYIIKPIGARSLHTEQALAEFEKEHGDRLTELRREQEGRVETLRIDQQARIDELRMKQVETETTLKIYVEIQTKVQQSLGRIEGSLSQVMGTQIAQAGSLSRLEIEVGEIRRLHMNVVNA